MTLMLMAWYRLFFSADKMLKITLVDRVMLKLEHTDLITYFIQP